MEQPSIKDFNTTITPGFYSLFDSGLEVPGNPGVTFGTVVIFTVQGGTDRFVVQMLFQVHSPFDVYFRTKNVTTNKPVDMSTIPWGKFSFQNL